ncbi:hypothetical protein GQ43DRAFT_16379 [Delitschia confertaspora ATCC 74209]|uniref:Uncharacterized protein n=1 Tax=Delitschia confertaspora ATCC 74209 TaxID=1513339 RepID=A0A9P4JYA4_9PLEO|nr:hypothetical protein GQ43DRAFT_16379 [Delitschia confertaspora ATCC 74209]
MAFWQCIGVQKDEECKQEDGSPELQRLEIVVIRHQKTFICSIRSSSFSAAAQRLTYRVRPHHSRNAIPFHHIALFRGAEPTCPVSISLRFRSSALNPGRRQYSGVWGKVQTREGGDRWAMLYQKSVSVLSTGCARDSLAALDTLLPHSGRGRTLQGSLHFTRTSPDLPIRHMA